MAAQCQKKHQQAQMGKARVKGFQSLRRRSETGARSFEALYWIAELGTFERAAARLNTTQSAVSKRVQELERGSRIEVFDHNRRGAKLTAHGDDLFDVAKQILRLHDQIAEIQQGVTNRPRSLRIGVTELTTITWLPQLIAAIKGRFGNVQISPKVDMTKALFRGLEQSQLDLIIVPKHSHYLNLRPSL